MVSGFLAAITAITFLAVMVLVALVSALASVIIYFIEQLRYGHGS